MSYFGFLAVFLLIPTAILGAVSFLESRWRRASRLRMDIRWGLVAVLLHVLIAVLYTTPWDNYLVATRVWWYAPNLVAGVTLGWVPIEEYTFFVLQTLMVGLWVLLLTRLFGHGREGAGDLDGPAPISALRIGAPALAMGFWTIAAVVLVKGWAPGTYLALELVWALPPIALQLAYGADILWQHQRIVVLAIVPFTLYLSLADTLAIRSGTWTINPEQSVGLLLGGVLPVEELLFFLLTNTLVVFGVTLLLAPESHRRIQSYRLRWRSSGFSAMNVNE
jgi:lycopene cyclase domain-containing protein